MPTRTSGDINSNDDLVDSKENQKDDFDDKKFSKPRFSINLVIILMISLHYKVENKEGIYDW